MTVQPLSAEQWWLIVATLGGLFVASVTFNAWIDRQTDIDPEGAGSYFWVVFGVGYTLLGIYAILSIVFGAQAALWIVAIALACFSASGLPMIFGDIRRNMYQRNAYHYELQQRTSEESEEFEL